MNVFYRVLRFLTRKTLQIYFKNISFSGRDRLKTDGPRIITVNHPASFLDACVLAAFLPGPLYFLVRGDVFHPWFRFFFRLTYQIPIYRFRDGFGNLRRNARTFKEVYEMLADDKTVVIFAEGLTEYEKKLRPIQRGAARMAVGFKKAFPRKSMHLQAVGINYEDIYRFRSHVQVHIGSDFRPRLSVDTKKDIQTLTAEIQRQLSNLVVHLNTAEREEIYNIWARRDGLFSLPAGKARHPQFVLADRINQMSESEVSLLLKQPTFCGAEISTNHRKRTFSSKLQCLGFDLLYLLLFPFYYLPAWAGRQVARTQFTHPSFLQPVAIGMGMFFYLFWVIILTLLSLVVFPSVWVPFGIMVIFVYLGTRFAVKLWEFRRKKCK